MKLLTGILVVMLVVPFGVAWAAQATGARPTAGGDGIRVQTDDDSYHYGDTVHIWLRNVGSEPLDGTPRLMVLSEGGAVVQSFSFAQFVIELEPGEAVWVEWSTGPQPVPCMYGEASGGDRAAPSGRIYPCPMEGAGIPAPESDAATPGTACYACRPIRVQPSTYVLVGIFGDQADAGVIRVT